MAVHPDGRGDVVTSGARAEYSYMHACVAVGHVDAGTGERASALVRGMPYERCTVDQMIPVVRDVLVGGIFEFGASGPAQTVRRRVREAAWCAEWLAEMRKEPFIAGMAGRWITVAPLSERYRFVEQASCVFNGSEAGACQTRSRPGSPRRACAAGCATRMSRSPQISARWW